MKTVIVVTISMGISLLATSAFAKETTPDAIIYDEYGAISKPLTEIAGDPVAGKKNSY